MLSVRKYLVSIGFGAIGFYVNFHAISFAQFPQFKISILTGMLFPLLITLAWGWRCGLVSALAGGCQSMWWLWRSDGCGLMYSVPVFTLWIVWHGIWSDYRRRHPSTRWYHSMYAVELPFRLLCELGFYTLFRYLVSLNPPPWDPGVTWNHVPLSWAHFVAVKHIVVAYILLLVCHVLIHLGPVRRFMQMESGPDQENTTFVVSASLLVGLGIWGVDGVVVWLTAIDSGNLLDAIVLNINPPDLFMRNILLLVCLGAGLLISRLLSQRFEREEAVRVSEAKYRELSAKLEQRVKARTAQLQSTNHELEAFAYSVSHDLRTPLRGIDGLSQVLLEDYSEKLDDQGKDYINRVRAATQRMGRLIDDLLTLSRMTRVEMKHDTVNLSLLAEAVFEAMQARAPQRQVRFSVAPDLTVIGDASLLRVAVENLLGNAWKFTGKVKAPEIDFGVQRQKGETVYYLRDNGAGFDMAYADKLFGAFQRLHGTTEFPGTGIGLATVQRIVHRHGGRIWADAKVDNGAVFYFTLSR